MDSLCECRKLSIFQSNKIIQTQFNSTKCCLKGWQLMSWQEIPCLYIYKSPSLCPLQGTSIQYILQSVSVRYFLILFTYLHHSPKQFLSGRLSFLLNSLHNYEFINHHISSHSKHFLDFRNEDLTFLSKPDNCQGR